MTYFDKGWTSKVSSKKMQKASQTVFFVITDELNLIQQSSGPKPFEHSVCREVESIVVTDKAYTDPVLMSIESVVKVHKDFSFAFPHSLVKILNTYGSQNLPDVRLGK